MSTRNDDQLVDAARRREADRLEVRDRLVVAALAALLGGASALLIAIPGGHVRHASPELVLALVAAFALAARVEFEVAFASSVPTQLVFVPMLFLAAPGWVPLMVAAGFMLSKLPDRMHGGLHPERMAVHAVSSWFALGPAVVLWVAGDPAPTVAHLPVIAAALLAQFAGDGAAGLARGRLGLGLPARVLPRMLAPAWLVDLSLTPLGLALAALSQSTPAAFLIGLPLIGLLAYFARERKARIDHALELSHAYRGTALLLGDMVEADDAYTGLHSRDVVDLVLAVADRMALHGDLRLAAELTALLHDVGKVRIPDAIINKPGALTEAERRVIETHTIEGQRMLDQVGGLLAEVGGLVRSCHERWDGGGYPDGLAGEAIPLVARIVCACDAYSAMTTSRSYRPAMPREAALAELRRCAGSHFDPLVVEALIAVASAQAAGAPAELRPAA